MKGVGGTTRYLAAVLVVHLATGCSLLFVDKAPAGAQPSPYVPCTETRVWPVVDGVLGVTYGLAAIGVSFDDSVDDRQVVAPAIGVLALGLLYSSVVGFRETGRCRELHRAGMVAPYGYPPQPYPYPPPQPQPYPPPQPQQMSAPSGAPGGGA